MGVMGVFIIQRDELVMYKKENVLEGCLVATVVIVIVIVSLLQGKES